jgi:ribose 5-phosphate isomerase B
MGKDQVDACSLLSSPEARKDVLMRIVIGSDHAGYEMKEKIVDAVKKFGYEVTDVGTHEPDKPDDYPDFAQLVAQKIQAEEADRGIVICGSGVGVSVAANKFKGIRAAVCHDHYSAHQGVEHDDMNVLVLGARIVGLQVALDLSEAFLTARFSNEERHVRRLNKVKEIENEEFR